MIHNNKLLFESFVLEIPIDRLNFELTANSNHQHWSVTNGHTSNRLSIKLLNTLLDLLHFTI